MKIACPGNVFFDSLKEILKIVCPDRVCYVLEESQAGKEGPTNSQTASQPHIDRQKRSTWKNKKSGSRGDSIYIYIYIYIIVDLYLYFSLSISIL